MVHHSSALDVLLSRVSTDRLSEPPPEGETLRAILSAGLRAPDHGQLRPWRYVVIAGARRDAFARRVVEAMSRQEPDLPQAKTEKRYRRFATAPAVIALGMHLRPHHKIPLAEQEMAVAAGAMNVLNALHSEGFGGVWVSGPFCADRPLLEGLGLADPHRLAGFLLVGTPQEPPLKRKRPDIDDYCAFWDEKGVRFAAEEA